MICFLLVSCFALAQHDMSLAFHGYILQYAGIADEVECRPEVGVDAVGADGGAGASEKSALRARQGGGLAVATKQGLIEHRHLFRAAGIIDFPEGGQQGSRASVEEAATEANHFVHTADDCTARLAGAERDEGTVGKIEVKDIDGVKLSIGQPDVREVG